MSREKLSSEKVVVAAPMSFVGSAQRIWKIADVSNAALKWLLCVPGVLVLISVAWTVIACWYLIFGLWLVPYRLLRRSARKNKRDKLRHQEVLTAIEKRESN